MNWFNSAYNGTPPWDIGRPQSEFVSLAESGEIAGSVLDVGCGTGENAIFLASKGHEVLGVDSAPLAVKKARIKAKERASGALFAVHDALDLPSLGKQFDTVIDSGFFHTLSDEEREVFVHGLSRVIRRGGRYIMLCFSDKEPDDGGPRRVSQSEIRETFKDGWRVDWIRESKFEAKRGNHYPRAWIASMTRL